MGIERKGYCFGLLAGCLLTASRMAGYVYTNTAHQTIEVQVAPSRAADLLTCDCRRRHLPVRPALEFEALHGVSFIGAVGP
jgi:hypothetical protein